MVPEKLREVYFKGEAPSISAMEQSLECRGSYFRGRDTVGYGRRSHQILVPVNFEIFSIDSPHAHCNAYDCVVQVVALDKTLTGQHGKVISGWGKILEIFHRMSQEFIRPEGEDWIFVFVVDTTFREGTGKIWTAAEFLEKWRSFTADMTGNRMLQSTLDAFPDTLKRNFKM